MTTNTELAAAKRFLEERCPAGTRVLCAVSGGMDSMCLLYLLSAWGRETGIAVTAAHYNHLHRGEESYRDETFVRERCEEMGIPFVCGRGDMIGHAEKTGQTLEEAGRELRYGFLAEQMRLTESNFILTAHHADDNAETVLLNLLRGAGARGLSGIPAERDGILRPFLCHTREELAAYAERRGVLWLEDTTNALDVAARNVLRHRVLPALRELNPKAVENIARAAELLRRDEETLSAMAEELLRSSGHFEENRARLAVSPLLEAERAVADRAVDEAVTRAAGHRKDLTARHVEAVRELLTAGAGKEVSLPYGLTARREAESILLFPAAESPVEIPLRVGETVSFGGWSVELAENDGWELHVPPEAALSVTAWQRDDRMTLPGSRGGRSLKRLCAERGIPPAERDGLPVLRVNGVCAAVPGVGVHCEFLSGEGRAVYVNFKKTEEKGI